MNANDLFLGLLCAGAAINLVLFAPAGALIGAALGKRVSDSAGLGLLFGPIGLGLIATLPTLRAGLPPCPVKLPSGVELKPGEMYDVPPGVSYFPKDATGRPW